MTKEQTGEERAYYTSTLLFITEGSQDRNSIQGRIPEARVDAEAMEGSCLLACFPWLAQPDRTQDHKHTDGTSHHALGSPSLNTE